MFDEFIKTIIVDDELLAYNRLVKLLKQDKEIDIITVCNNSLVAIEAINENKPDLIFIDLNIPGLNGFNLVQKLNRDHDPIIVFVSADDKYGVKAFEVNAFDYLLKPYSIERLNHTVLGAKKRLGLN